jgi:hypothetical protein
MVLFYPSLRLIAFLKFDFRRWPSNNELESNPMWKREQRLVADRSGLGYPSDLTVVFMKQGTVLLDIVRGLRQQFDGKAIVAP